MKESSSSGKTKKFSSTHRVSSSHTKSVKGNEVDRRLQRHLKPMKNNNNANITLLHVPVEELTEQDTVNLIAELSEAILEDPTSAFKTLESSLEGSRKDVAVVPSKFQRLYELAAQSPKQLEQDEPSTTTTTVTTQRLAILSLMAVFQDIVPSYRIRPPSEMELAVKVSKETKKLWDYERTLLTQYQMFLKLLEKLISSTSSSSSRLIYSSKASPSSSSSSSSLAITAILCLCELLTSLPHFNFRSNILSIIVKHMNHKTCPEIQQACCQTITTLFTTDKQGEISLEATRLICHTIKDHPLTIHPSVVRTFLSLPLRIHDDEAQAAKMIEKVQMKKRKRDVELAQVEKDLKEGDATVDTILVAKYQGDILQRITVTYFRILKSVAEKQARIMDVDKEEEEDKTTTTILSMKKHHPRRRKIKKTSYHPLLSVALEGLARFSHLIHFDAITDLLHVLKSVVQQDDTLGLEASLNCIYTALQTLQGPGKELPVDPKEYFIPLYRQLQGYVTCMTLYILCFLMKYKKKINCLFLQIYILLGSSLKPMPRIIQLWH